MTRFAATERQGVIRRLRSHPRQLASAGGWSLLFQLTSKLSLLGALGLTARTVGHSDFGTFVALQGLAVLAGLVLDLGISTMAGRELAAGALSNELLRRIVSMRASVVLTAATLGTASVLLVPMRSELRWELAFFVLAALCIDTSVLALLLLEGRLDYRGAALCQSGGRLAYLATSAAAALQPKPGPARFAASFAIGELIIAASSGWLAWRQLRHHGCPGIGMPDRWVRKASAYWLNTVFNLTYNRADTAAVLMLAGAAQSALYAPASSIQNALLVVPGLAVAGLPNVGASIYQGGAGRRQLVASFRIAISIAIGFGLLAAALATVIMPQLVDLVAGHTYNGSVGPSIVLAWSSPFYAAQLACIALLVAMGRGPATTAVYGAALIGAAAAHAAITPRFGALGGAWASLLREPGALIVAYLLVRRALRQETDGPASAEST